MAGLQRFQLRELGGREAEHAIPGHRVDGGAGFLGETQGDGVLGGQFAGQRVGRRFQFGGGQAAGGKAVAFSLHAVEFLAGQ